MNFFEICQPDYDTDAQAEHHNPICELEDIPVVPSMKCPRCFPKEGLWASKARIRVGEVSSKIIESYFSMPFIHCDDWPLYRIGLSQALAVEPNKIEPGAEVGPPKAKLRSGHLHDIVHIFPGQIWISEKVRDYLEKANIKGVRYEPVIISPGGNTNVRLFEFVVESNAWRPGSSIDKIRECDVCGRSRSTNEFPFKIDLSTWDGSDIFTLDLNPNAIFISERVVEILKNGSFDNYRLIQLEK